MRRRSVAPIKQPNRRMPYKQRHNIARSHIVVLPLPLGMASANSPPCNTAASILRITPMVGAEGQGKGVGKIVFQNDSSDFAHLRRRYRLPGPGYPVLMSRSVLLAFALRARASSFFRA